MYAPDELRRQRFALARGVLLYGAVVAGDAAVIWYIITRGVQGIGYVSLTLVAVFGLLVFTQLLSHLRDLFAPPVETEGEILRMWHRAELVIAWPSYFIQIDRAIFRIPARDYLLLKEGEWVRVAHFRYTANVIAMQPVGGARAPALGP